MRALVLVALSNSHQTINYSPLQIPIFLAGGIISLTLFVIVEKRAISPLVGPTKRICTGTSEFKDLRKVRLTPS